MIQAAPIINQVLDHPLLEQKGIELAVKRLDLIHPLVSGNKFYKLKYNLLQAKAQDCKSVLTFGGAYSNHIQATAAACRLVGLDSIGLIRGEETLPLNPTLAFAQDHGMKLAYLSRGDYRKKKEGQFLADLQNQFPNTFIIPEGGTNEWAIQGTAEILGAEDSKFSHIIAPIGTGGTFAGLVQSLSTEQKAIGISSLKGNFIIEEVRQILQETGEFPNTSWTVFTDYHFGGYAKYTQALIDFIWDFHRSFGIVLDPIYTGKMMYGLWELIQQDYFPPGSKILAVHTGGIQGNKGFFERTQISLPLPSR